MSTRTQLLAANKIVTNSNIQEAWNCEIDNLECSESENFSFGSYKDDHIKAKNTEVLQLFKFFIQFKLKLPLDQFRTSQKFVEQFVNLVTEFDYSKPKVFGMVLKERLSNYEDFIMFHKHSSNLTETKTMELITYKS